MSVPILRFSAPPEQVEWVMGMVKDAFLAGTFSGAYAALGGASFKDGWTQESAAKNVQKDWGNTADWVAIPVEGLLNGYPLWDATIVSPKVRSQAEAA